MSLIQVGKVVLNRLIENGYEAYFVGGMVRDQLLERDIYDIDITTSAKPHQVMALFEHTIETGLAHGTVTVMIDKIPVEVTTFRIEEGYKDYRRPSDVFFTTSLIEDLKRRDFTMNAIAQSIDGELIDPFNGLNDLNNHQIKAVGLAKDRFIEDPLRMLRGIRFVSKLGFHLDLKTEQAMNEVAELIAHISKERIKKEIEGMMSGTFSSEATNLLISTSLCDSIPYLDTLKQYQGKNLSILKEGIELFALIGMTVDDLNTYLKAWPFSNLEKRVIKGIRECYQKQIPAKYIQYKYKNELAFHYHRIQCFLNDIEGPFHLEALPIQNRGELALTTNEILELVSCEKGPWIGQFLEKLEYEVVMGMLENNQESLKAYIKKQQLGESYEIKK